MHIFKHRVQLLDFLTTHGVTMGNNIDLYNRLTILKQKMIQSGEYQENVVAKIREHALNNQAPFFKNRVETDSDSDTDSDTNSKTDDEYYEVYNFDIQEYIAKDKLLTNKESLFEDSLNRF